MPATTAHTLLLEHGKQKSPSAKTLRHVLTVYTTSVAVVSANNFFFHTSLGMAGGSQELRDSGILNQPLHCGSIHQTTCILQPR